MGKAEDFLNRQRRKTGEMSAEKTRETNVKTSRKNSELSTATTLFQSQFTEKRESQDKSNFSGRTFSQVNTTQEIASEKRSFTISHPRSISNSYSPPKTALSSSTSVVHPKKNSVFLYFVFCFAILVCGICLFFSSSEDKKSSNSTAGKYSNSDIRDSIFCVGVKQKDGMSVGTAFAVDAKNLITNKHVVSESVESRVVIAHPKWSKPQTAIIKEISQNYDLAWLQIEDQSINLIPLKLSENIAPQGAKVFTLGYPGYSYDQSNSIPEITLCDGIIKATNRNIGGNPCYETSATFNGGNSGGPLVDESFRVIGVNTFSLKLDRAVNCFYAIRVEAIKSAFPSLWNRIK